jgi:hypothetical protein
MVYFLHVYSQENDLLKRARALLFQVHVMTNKFIHPCSVVAVFEEVLTAVCTHKPTTVPAEFGNPGVHTHSQRHF